MKRVYSIFLALSVVLAFTLTGCNGATPAPDDTKDSEPHEETQNVEPAEQDPPAEQEPSADVEEPVSPEVLYASVLEKYTTALSQGYSRGELTDAGLNYMCMYHDAAEIGYAFLDADQNGTPELLVGPIGSEDGFFDLYTVIEDTTILVAQSSERDRYYICADGAIANEGSSGASNSTYAYYTIGAQGQMILSEAVIYDGEYSEDSPWYSTSAVSAEGAAPLSWESADLIFKKHEYIVVDYTAFLPDDAPNPEPAVKKPSGVIGAYDDIMGTYIDEDKTGIYMFIGYGDSSKTDAFIDVALVIDDVRVSIRYRDDDYNYISASDLDESIASEPSYAVSLDISSLDRISANIYISEYDYEESITFVPYPDAPYSNPFYVG